mgnify:CR=1 FL=1
MIYFTLDVAGVKVLVFPNEFKRMSSLSSREFKKSQDRMFSIISVNSLLSLELDAT